MIRFGKLNVPGKTCDQEHKPDSILSNLRKNVDEIEKKLESSSITLSIQILSYIINQDSALQDGWQLNFKCVIQDSEM